MKIISKIILGFIIAIIGFSNVTFAISSNQGNLKIGGNEALENTIVDNNNRLNSLKNDDFEIEEGGGKGIRNTFILIARDLKNLFFILAGIYLLVLVLKLLFSAKTDEEVSNFKKGIIWISVGIIVTQLSYFIIVELFDKNINSTLADNFVGAILVPFIGLLETLAAIFFFIMMVFAFFKMVTANGDEEKAKSGKMMVLYAIVGYIVVKLSRTLVDSIYSKTGSNVSIEGAGNIIVNIINWMNGFVGIIVVLMIIYAGFTVLTGAGDEEKLKKAKTSILYIAIGVLILVINYLILTFFILAPASSGL